MKHTFALLSVFSVFVPGAALAERPTRFVFRADTVPVAQAMEIAPSRAVLPSGFRAGAKSPVAPGVEYTGRCLDGREASVRDWGGDGGMETIKIHVLDGNTYLDLAKLDTKDGTIKIESATRTRVVKVTDVAPGAPIFAHRTATEIVFWAALDEGIITHGIVFWGCTFRDTHVSLPVKSFHFSSSVADADSVMRRMHQVGGPLVPLRGMNFAVQGSVSKSSSDPAPLVSLLAHKI